MELVQGSFLFFKLRIGNDFVYKNHNFSIRHSLEAWSGSQSDLGSMEFKIKHISCNDVRTIIIFCTIWDDTSKLLDKIKVNNFHGNLNKFMIFPLHSFMLTIHQQEIFAPVAPKKRKIIFDNKYW